MTPKSWQEIVAMPRNLFFCLTPPCCLSFRKKERKKQRKKEKQPSAFRSSSFFSLILSFSLSLFLFSFLSFIYFLSLLFSFSLSLFLSCSLFLHTCLLRERKSQSDARMSEQPFEWVCCIERKYRSQFWLKSNKIWQVWLHSIS